MKVGIIGGGVVGLCAAHALRVAGADVTLLERGRCGHAASLGNAGWVTPGLSAPLPAPGVMRQAARWMLDRESPLLIRPRMDPSFLAWSVGFWRNCSPRAYRHGMAATLRLASGTLDAFDRLRNHGVEFEMHEDGLLFLVRSEAALQQWLDLYEDLRALGFDGRVTALDRAGLLALEPAVGDTVVAGLLAGRERHVRPETLTAGLRAALSRLGVAMHEGAEVTRITKSPDGGWRLMTPDGSQEFDRVLVAAGVWSRHVLGLVGVPIPLEAAKGYSITARGHGERPGRPLYLTEIKVGVSPFDGAVRLAGTFELAGLDLSMNARRIGAIARGASDYVRAWRPGEARAEWAGLRPLAPDAVPIVGPVPGRPGMYVATGHGMLGVTLAPATAEALVPLLMEDSVVPELTGLGLDRFARRGAPMADVKPARAVA